MQNRHRFQQMSVCIRPCLADTRDYRNVVLINRRLVCAYTISPQEFVIFFFYFLFVRCSFISFAPIYCRRFEQQHQQQIINDSSKKGTTTIRQKKNTETDFTWGYCMGVIVRYVYNERWFYLCAILRMNVRTNDRLSSIHFRRLSAPLS